MTTPTPQPSSDAQPLLPADPRAPAFELRRLTSSIGPNVIVPIIIYRLMTSHGSSELSALALAALAPAGGIAWAWLRSRRLSVIGIASLLTIGLGLVLSLISGNALLLLLKESFLFALFGLLCWGSLLLSRPLIFTVGRSIAARRDPALGRGYDERWQDPSFRRRQSLMTAVWGAAFVAIAVLRAVMALMLPVTFFLVVAPVLALVVSAGLIAWSLRWGRPSRV